MIRIALLFARWWVLEVRHEIKSALSSLLPPCACPGCDECASDGHGNCTRASADSVYCAACAPRKAGAR